MLKFICQVFAQSTSLLRSSLACWGPLVDEFLCKVVADELLCKVVVIVIVIVIAARQAVRPTSSNQLLGQTFRPISSNQLLVNYFSIHSQHSKKEGRQGRIELKLRHHHYYPPQLLQMKRWGEERSEEELQKTQSHSHSTHSKKSREQNIMIDVMGWLLPPHSSGTRQAHQCTKNGQLTWRIVK